jgi:hypothetical protein
MSPLKAENLGWHSPATAEPALVPGAKIPVQIPAPPGTSDPVTVLRDVNLLTYAPCFDVDREQWFVDLDLSAPETPNVFARLGLVRFQPNAISDELKVSDPVVVWTQLMPERKLKVHTEKKKESRKEGKEERMVDALYVCCSVSGNAHKEVRVPRIPPDVDFKDIDLSKLSKLMQPAAHFRLVHESDELGVLRRIMLDQACIQPCKIADSNQKWEARFRIEMDEISDLGSGTIYVYAEEIETYMPATYETEPAYIRDIFNSRTFIESGARYAGRLGVDT